VVPPVVPEEPYDEEADELLKAQEKLDDKLLDMHIDREREIADIIRDYGDKQIDEAIKNADKRIDLARKNSQKIEDIYRKQQQAIADAGTDLSRKEADIARKAARDRVEVERDTAREQLDIERDYRRELQRIRDRFNQSAAEAERNNDAQAFLAAMRQRDLEFNEAKRDRQEGIEDAGKRATEQREEVNRQLQYEIEDARIANQRKLEDLQIRLNRELEAQRINYARDLEAQTLNEERKRAEMERSYQLELRDFAIKEAQRVADLQRSLSKEFKLIRDHERNVRNLRIAEAQRTRATLNRFMNINPFGSTAGSRRSSFASTIAASFGRQEGGPVEAGRPYIVGERGPELFVPAQAGAVLANTVTLPAPAAAQTVSNVSTSLSNSFNVSESLFSDPVATRKLQNLIMEVVAGVI
jgi:hypothetical protein